PGWGGWADCHARNVSGRLADSILMTSAPRSARIWVALAPAVMVPKSTMRVPSSASVTLGSGLLLLLALPDVGALARGRLTFQDPLDGRVAIGKSSPIGTSNLRPYVAAIHQAL